MAHSFVMSAPKSGAVDRVYARPTNAECVGFAGLGLTKKDRFLGILAGTSLTCNHRFDDKGVCLKCDQHVGKACDDTVFVIECGQEVLLPTISEDPIIQAFYVMCRYQGGTHKFAEMCALQQPCGISGTDSLFLEGRCDGNQFEKHPYIGNYYKAVAARHGVNVKGKVYLSSLAKFPGDPHAWVSGRGDVKRVLDDNNWSADGAVKRQEVRGVHDGEPPVDVAEDIVDRNVHNEIRKNPEAKHDKTLRERVKQRLKPKV